MTHRSRTRQGRVRVLALFGLVAVGAVMAPAVADQPEARLVLPGSFGPVDFGDRVAYRLVGSACRRDLVHVVVTAGPNHAVIAGPPSHPMTDPLASGPNTCAGVVTVPRERQVRATGYASGDPLSIVVASGHSQVPLRYQRVEVDQGKVVSGSPTRLRSNDTRSGPRDQAMSMGTGDVVSLGHVDLTNIYSIALRTCLPLPRPHTPVMFELRAGAPDGPSIIGTLDIADDVLNNYHSFNGWKDCWILAGWPITQHVPGRAPELFAAVVAAPEPMSINWIDFTGTGAKLPDEPPRDPAGTKQVFDGRSFAGWEQSGCGLADGGVRTTDHVNGCQMTFTRQKFHNILIRLEYRQASFASHGGISAGAGIHVREPGEFLVGGIQGDLTKEAAVGFALPYEITYGSGYAAQRIKTNSWPAWSQMEIVQIGGRYIVRINGRTVTDYVIPGGDSGPYNLNLHTEPQFSEEAAVGTRFDTVISNPTITGPEAWGDLWFKNVRVYSCRSLKDPICTGGPGING